MRKNHLAFFSAACREFEKDAKRKGLTKWKAVISAAGISYSEISKKSTAKNKEWIIQELNNLKEKGSDLSTRDLITNNSYLYDQIITNPEIKKIAEIESKKRGVKG